MSANIGLCVFFLATAGALNIWNVTKFPSTPSTATRVLNSGNVTKFPSTTSTTTGALNTGNVTKFPSTTSKALSTNHICGERLPGGTGIVTSPNYPADYQERSHCGWLLTVPTQHIVKLTFLDFELDPSCEYAGVILYDGPGVSSPRVAALCGQSVPYPIYYSSSSQMFIVFRAMGGTEAGRGFMAKYSAVIPSPRKKFGVVTSPSYPGLYPSFVKNYWTLTVSALDYVHLIFLDFDVYPSCHCKLDTLALFDGWNHSAPLIARLCGQELPNPTQYQSTSNHMYIEMFIREPLQVHGRGYKAVYYAMNCGGTLRGLTGSFTSPNYPRFYPKNTNCVWRIILPREYHIELNIHDLHVPSEQNCTHALEIHGGPEEAPQSLAKLCHNHTVSQTVTTMENIVIVRFSGDEVNQGFSASYRSMLDDCGGEFSTTSGVLMSQHNPKVYPPNTYCLWRITVQRGYSVQISFTAFEAKINASSAHDWLEVYDGSLNDSKRLPNYESGHPSPLQFKSSSNVMYLRMKTQNSGTPHGFSAEYTSVCGGVITEEAGILTSPNYPDPSPVSETCMWNIVTDQGNRIQLTITDLNIAATNGCHAGEFEINEGQNSTSTLTRLCHTQSTPQVITSAQNSMTVKFVGGKTGKGFSASYMRISEECGGMYSTRSGVITASIHPQLISGQRDCHWIITVESGRSVIFSFTHFDVGKFFKGHCLNGDVAIYDGKSEQSRGMLKHCGSTVPLISSFTSTSNHLYISMKTFKNTSGDGFKAEYKSSGIRCGRRGGLPHKETRIYKGQEASRHSAPWQAALHFVTSNNTVQFRCGGTVLSEYWVLSAAHCVCKRNINVFNVTVGRLTTYNYSVGQQSFEVADVVVHEKYDDITQDYDIALIKVKPLRSHGIKFNEYVEPACLPSVMSVYSPGKICHISGFGDTENGHAYTLRETNLTIYDSRICNATANYNGTITPRMFCAGRANSVQGPCHGDSGGPFVCVDGGRFTLYGATSWMNRECFDHSYASVFMNVNSVLDWIQENTGIDAKN